MSDLFPSAWHMIPTLLTASVILVSIGIWVGNVNSDRKSFKEFMKKFEAKLDRLLERLPPVPPVGLVSPVKLKSVGEKISESLAVKTWSAKHAARIQNHVLGKPEFEIFENCVEYVSNQTEQDSALHRAICEEAYNRGMDAEMIKKVYEVELRDALLTFRES